MSVDYQEFAKMWERDWNSHDLDRILSHYHRDICFRSRKALNLVGSGEINGAKALRAYWARSLEQQPTLKFKVLDVFSGHNMMVITYLNHRDVRAAETLYLMIMAWFFRHRPATTRAEAG